jgi:high affinity Mn2+ porin
MDNKLVICLQIGLAGLLGLRSVAPVGAQEVSATPAEQAVTPAGEQVPVLAKDEKAQDWGFHAQSTIVYQYHPTFTSPYQGPNSLTAPAQGKETFDLTLYGGVRLWKGAEFWINPEIDQGFGLSDTLGVAGFPNGEAYKVGSTQPYGRVPRAFLRQTVNLGGDPVAVDADLNQLAGTQSANRVVITVGKFSVVDIFDTSAYAHDPRKDFLNWSIIDSAAFDYAANAWGYTYGVAAEWYQGQNAFRLGLFDLSIVPNSTQLDPHVLPQFQVVAEWERQYEIAAQPGILRLLGFAMRANMGEYDQATAIAQMTGEPADIAAVRSFHTKFGVAFNLQQQLASDIGFFVRISADQGQYEAYEFTDVNESYALGLSMTGERWSRPRDSFGAAIVVNRASSAAEGFFNAGGLGILIGDGQLPHPSSERLVETYYSFSLVEGVSLSLDYQFIDNPAYNRDRGPVSVFGLRFHAQF